MLFAACWTIVVTRPCVIQQGTSIILVQYCTKVFGLLDSYSFQKLYCTCIPVRCYYHPFTTVFMNLLDDERHQCSQSKVGVSLSHALNHLSLKRATTFNINSKIFIVLYCIYCINTRDGGD